MAERTVLRAIAWAWILLPIIPLAVGWIVLGRSTPKRTEQAIILLVAMVSYGWLLVGILVPPAVGPDYSTRRYVTILFNLILMTGISLWALRRGPDLKRPEWLATLSTASVWFYALAMSSVV